MREKNGFGLLEVLIAFGLLGLLAYGLTSYLDIANKAQKRVQGNVEFDVLRTNIKLILDKKLCGMNFKNSDGTQIAKFSSTTPPSPSESVGSIYFGDVLLAKNGFVIGGGTKVSKIEIEDTGLMSIVQGSNTVNFVKMIIEVDRGGGGTNNKVSNTLNPFIFALTTDSNNRIIGCSSDVNETFRYPASCNFRFDHRDNGGVTRSVNLDMSSPGHVGLRFTGNVNSDDRITVSGSCDPSKGNLDKYIASCEIGLGERDKTDNANANLTPARSATMNFSGANGSFFFEGDVNEDDSFYFRMRCPTPTDPEQVEVSEYVKNSCFICFGYSDLFRPQMDTRHCSRVQDISDNTWARFRLTGDVNSDDVIYPGFYCNNDNAPIVKNIVW